MTVDRSAAPGVLADQIKERLLDSILQGRYEPDSRIVETRVAKELGTSQAPVREALRSLEALGVVEITRYRGARVRRPGTGELLEAFVVRCELESLAIRLCVPRLSEPELQELRELHDDIGRAAREGNHPAMSVADAHFHAKILEASGNAVLLRVWGALEPLLRTYITLLTPGMDAVSIAQLHTPILEALQRRDMEGALHALQRHFKEASGRFQLARELRAPGGDDTVDDKDQ